MRSNVFMGRHSGLGRRCTVAAGMHNITGVSINSDTIMAKKSNYSNEELARLNIRSDQTDVKEMNSKPVIIGNDVFLGDNIIIMPGVTIGTGSVIAANSVVSRDIPPYVVAGGTPCAPIRDRFPDEVKTMLLKTHWWNAKLDILQNLPIDNVFKFVDSFNETYEILEILYGIQFLRWDMSMSDWVINVELDLMTASNSDLLELIDLCAKHTCVNIPNQKLTIEREAEIVKSFPNPYVLFTPDSPNFERSALDAEGYIGLVSENSIAGHKEEMTWHNESPHARPGSSIAWLYAEKGVDGSVTSWNNTVLAYADLDNAMKETIKI